MQVHMDSDAHIGPWTGLVAVPVFVMNLCCNSNSLILCSYVLESCMFQSIAVFPAFDYLACVGGSIPSVSVLPCQTCMWGCELWAC